MARLTTFLLWAVAGSGVGFAAFLVAPFAAGALDQQTRQRVGDFYSKLMTLALDKGALAPRSETDLTLLSWSYGPRDLPETTLDETRHVPDDMDAVGRLHNRQFGFALLDPAAFVTLRCAALGRAAAEVDADGDFGSVDYNGEEAKNFHVELPERPRLLSLSAARKLVPGDADSERYEDSYEYVKKSQEGFSQPLSAGQTMMIVLSFAVGFGLVILALKYGQPTGGGSSVIPAMLGVGV